MKRLIPAVLVASGLMLGSGVALAQNNSNQQSLTQKIGQQYDNAKTKVGQQYDKGKQDLKNLGNKMKNGHTCTKGKLNKNCGCHKVKQGCGCQKNK